MGDELWCGQALIGVNLAFDLKFDLDFQGQLLHKTTGTLTKFLCTFGPNLVILAWTRPALLHRHASDWHTDWHTHRHTDAGNDNTPRPKMASGKNVFENVVQKMAATLSRPQCVKEDQASKINKFVCFWWDYESLFRSIAALASSIHKMIPVPYFYKPTLEETVAAWSQINTWRWLAETWTCSPPSDTSLAWRFWADWPNIWPQPLPVSGQISQSCLGLSRSDVLLILRLLLHHSRDLQTRTGMRVVTNKITYNCLWHN